MKRLVLIIRVHEGGLGMNPYSAKQSRGLKGWLAVQGNVPGDSIDMDKHYRSTK